MKYEIANPQAQAGACRVLSVDNEDLRKSMHEVIHSKFKGLGERVTKGVKDIEEHLRRNARTNGADNLRNTNLRVSMEEIKPFQSNEYQTWGGLTWHEALFF